MGSFKQLVVIFLFLAQSNQLSAEIYSLGSGLNVGKWNFSGYSNIEFKMPEHGSTELEIDDVAIFIRGNINSYINLFFEGEFSGQPIWVESEGVFSSGAGHFVLERLYNDSYLTEDLSLRVGKMLAHVGEWNLIHAAPLVWTTTRPLTTYYNFSEFISGVSVNKISNNPIIPSVNVYYQPWQAFSPKPISSRSRRYASTRGVGLTWDSEIDWRFGLSVQNARLKYRGENQTLLSIDGRYDFGFISVEAQTSYTWLSEQNNLSLRDYG